MTVMRNQRSLSMTLNVSEVATVPYAAERMAIYILPHAPKHESDRASH
jgi:hypothetical protein